jgi:hypothetical protein
MVVNDPDEVSPTEIVSGGDRAVREGATIGGARVAQAPVNRAVDELGRLDLPPLELGLVPTS